MSFQFLEKSKSAGEKMVSSVRRRIENTIDEQFSQFELTNGKKRADFIVSVGKLHFDFIEVKLYILETSSVESHWKSSSDAFCRFISGKSRFTQCSAQKDDN